MTAVQAALSGALIGGLYALMAAGLSVTWGVLRVINLAHFGLILVGAYLTYQLTHHLGSRPDPHACWSRRRCCSSWGPPCNGPTNGSTSPSSTRCW